MTISHSGLLFLGHPVYDIPPWTCSVSSYGSLSAACSMSDQKRQNPRERIKAKTFRSTGCGKKVST